MTAWYEHLTFRAGAMARGGLITLIYSKMMRLPTTDLNESSAVALMGNDVETLTEKLHVLLVESWANTLTVGIAMYMLADQLGAVCVAPIITAISEFSWRYDVWPHPDLSSLDFPLEHRGQDDGPPSDGVPEVNSRPHQLHLRGTWVNESCKNAGLDGAVQGPHCAEARRGAGSRHTLPLGIRLLQLHKYALFHYVLPCINF